MRRRRHGTLSLRQAAVLSSCHQLAQASAAANVRGQAVKNKAPLLGSCRSQLFRGIKPHHDLVCVYTKAPRADDIRSRNLAHPSDPDWPWPRADMSPVLSCTIPRVLNHDGVLVCFAHAPGVRERNNKSFARGLRFLRPFAGFYPTQLRHSPEDPHIELLESVISGPVESCPLLTDTTIRPPRGAAKVKRWRTDRAISGRITDRRQNRQSPKTKTRFHQNSRFLFCWFLARTDGPVRTKPSLGLFQAIGHTSGFEGSHMKVIEIGKEKQIMPMKNQQYSVRRGSKVGQQPLTITGVLELPGKKLLIGRWIAAAAELCAKMAGKQPAG